MTTSEEAAGPSGDRSRLRNIKSQIASHRWLFAALGAVGAVAIVGLAFVMHRALSSSSSPPPVQSAPPAKLVSTPAAAFPLKVGPTGRYLVDRHGRPFLIVGDSPQALVVDVSVKQAGRYFANREAAGFNSLWINLVADTYTGGRANGSTYDGIVPFNRPGDLATPNPAYFARASAIIGLAAKHHLAVFLDPIETGGWLKVLRSNGTARAYQYGRYLGRRYERYSNIVWLNGNDFQAWRDPADDAVALAVAKGIRSADPHALQTIELNYQSSTSLDDARWRGLVSLDAAYTYYPTYAEVLTAYRNSDHIPAFMLEANYEGELAYTGPLTLRREEYWAMLSGASGQFYGNTWTWQFLHGWPHHVSSIGSRQETFLVNLFSHRAWFDLVPDIKHRLVVSGYGAYSDSGTVNSSDYVTAARTPDGKLAMAYLPTGRPIVVDMRRIAGRRVRARWYDPTSGKYNAIPGSPFAHSARHRFTVPGRNSEGDHDWILVLEAA